MTSDELTPLIEAALLERRYEEALRLSAALTSLAHPNPYAYAWAGEALENLNRDREALQAYVAAVKIAPDVAPLHVRLGKLLLAYGEYPEAVRSLERAADLQPAHAETRLLLSQALSGANRSEEALPHLEAAVSDAGTSSTAHGMLAYWYQARGQFAVAREKFEASIAKNPRQALAYYGWAQSNRFASDTRYLLEQACELADDESMSADDRMYLHYVAGKGFADFGDYEQSMGHFDQANEAAFQLNLGGRPFQRKQYAEMIDATIAMFNRDQFKRLRGIGLNRRLPIFVVGMMRSGTTLVEQILSSHPEVCAAGELDFWLDNGRTAVELKSRAINEKQIPILASSYERLLRSIARDTPNVTDKMPQNFQMLGLIHIAFPKAPVIHIRRSPIDTCLSIYTTAYERSPEFAHDKESIVFAYKQYLRLVAHWRKVLPTDKFLEIDYEALTADPEPTIRKLIAFCGLPWNEACLHPEQNDRLVTTPSLWQVRQPVYRSAVERWRPYEPWLGKFQELLPSRSASSAPQSPVL